MNIRKFSYSLLAIIIATSCSEMLTPEEPEGAGFISVTAQVGVDVKAGYSSKTLPATFVMSIDQGSDESFNYNLTMTKAEENVYRANRDQLKWASSNHGNVLVNAMTLPSGIAMLNGESVRINLTKDQNTEEELNANDILGAKTGSGVTISGDNINVSFKHLMSKLHVVYESDDNITVTSIKLKNVSTSGVFNYARMSYVSSNDPSNNDEIDMCLNAVPEGLKAAEAIFYPYTSTASNKPSIVVTAKNSNGTTRTFAPVFFASNGITFEGGKRYMIKLQITEQGVNVSSLASDNAWVKNVPGGKILWLGTSIPAGSPTNNYPQMISNATGLEIVNNSIAATKVLREPLNTITRFDGNTYDTYEPFQWMTTKEAFDYKKAGGLSQTMQEAEDNYRERLMAISQNDKAWVDEQILAIQSLSYESLIIPYIDGTIDDCQTIVIDHGFNDLWGVDSYCGMLWEAREFYTDADYYHFILGYTNISALDKQSYNETYVPLIKKLPNLLPEEGSYLMAMERIIKAIYEAKTNARIIIGNYFAYDNPWVTASMAHKYAAFNLTGTLWCYNKAVAKIWGLDIVNVYESLSIEEGTFWNPEFEDPSKFCPDGVHPSSDATGNSNRRIADVYLDEFGRIFGDTNTRAISNTTDLSWEETEIL